MKNFKSSIKTITVATVFATLSSLSAPTFALAIFGVNEGNVPGTPANAFNADRINGSYNEVFTATGVNTFSAQTIFSFGSFSLSAGGANTSYLNSPEPTGYSAYGIVTSSGNFSISGAALSINAPNNTVELFLDPNSDTTLFLPGTGTGSVARTSEADDLRILADFSGIGVGSGDGAKPDPGNFAILFNSIALDPTGERYFTSPRPFYINLQANGNFNPFTPGVGSTTLQQGVANIFFSNNSVPEPASLALLGIGLLGMVATTTRRRKR